MMKPAAMTSDKAQSLRAGDCCGASSFARRHSDFVRVLASGLLISLPSCSMFGGAGDPDADDARDMQPQPRRTEMPSLYGPGSERVRAGSFPGIKFGDDDWRLSPAETEKVHTVARWLMGNPERMLVAAGAHAESPEYARQLSDLRAQTVRRALIAAGVGEEKIVTVSFGEDAPAATGEGVSFSIIGTGATR